MDLDDFGGGEFGVWHGCRFPPFGWLGLRGFGLNAKARRVAGPLLFLSISIVESWVQ
jgi:hypothetical protein